MLEGMLAKPVAHELDWFCRRGARAEQLADTQRLELLHVFFRNDAAADDEYVIGVFLLQQLDDARKQRHVRARENRQGYDVDIFLYRRARNHFRRLMQSRVDDFEACIAKRAGDDLRAAVVSVQS